MLLSSRLAGKKIAAKSLAGHAGLTCQPAPQLHRGIAIGARVWMTRTTQLLGAVGAARRLPPLQPECRGPQRRMLSGGNSIEKLQFETTASGLQYHDQKVGDGEEAEPGCVVQVRALLCARRPDRVVDAPEPACARVADRSTTPVSS